MSTNPPIRNSLPHQRSRIRPLIVALERFTNLTIPAQDKINKASENAAKYTIFVNRKHTLAHVVFKGQDMWVRVPIKAKGLHKVEDAVLAAYFDVRLKGWLINF